MLHKVFVIIFVSILYHNVLTIYHQGRHTYTPKQAVGSNWEFFYWQRKNYPTRGLGILSRAQLLVFVTP